MLIGIDGNEANVEKRVGIGQYASELLREFSVKDDALRVKFVVYLKNKPLSHMPEETENFKYRVFGPGKFWTQWRLPLDLYTHLPKPDVFFTPSHYAPRFSPIPTVISVMDLSYIYFPQLFNKKDLKQLTDWTEYSVRQAKRIITISNFSKNDIIKEYGLASDKIEVTYPGIKNDLGFMSYDLSSMNDLKKKYKISDNFVLFVGTLQPRKNIVRLVEAFSKIKDQTYLPVRQGSKKDSSAAPQDDIQLVIVGKKGWQYEEILDAPRKFGIEKYVKFLDSVDDSDLSVLYKNAVCFVLPSLYEGFGLPVLEAMREGCPVIASNVSSLPEAGGDACLYVDPEDADDIALKIKQLISDKKLRKLLVEKGKKQVSRFDWEKTAKQTLRVLEEAARDDK